MKERLTDIPRTVTLTDRELGALLATVAWIEDEPMAKSLSGIYARATGEDAATTSARYTANRGGAAFFNPPEQCPNRPYKGGCVLCPVRLLFSFGRKRECNWCDRPMPKTFMS